MPLDGALIWVEEGGAQARSDAAGAFVLLPAPALPARVCAVAPSLATRCVDVLSAGALRLSLDADADGYASTTVAVDIPPARTATTAQLDARDLAAAPRRNAEDALRQVPGLTLVQHGSEGKGHQFFLRGFDAMHGADLAMEVDGVPLNEWSNVHAQGYLDLGVIIPELIEGVELVKGPFGLDAGPFAMAGSTRFRLGVPPAERGWRVAYTVGTSNRHRVFVGASPRDSDDLFAAVEATHDDGFGARRGLRRATFNGGARLVELDGQRGTLDLRVLGGVADFELPGSVRDDDVEAGRIGFRGAYDRALGGRSGRGVVALRFARDHGGHAVEANAYGAYRDLRLTENFTGYLLDPVNGDRRRQEHRLGAFGADVRARHRVADAVGVLSGAGVRVEHLDQREVQLGRRLERVGTSRALDGTQLDAHARLGVGWAPTADWELEVGVRADALHFSVADRLDDGARGTGSVFLASPRALVTWQAAGAWRVFAAYGRGFRPPEARAFSRYEPEDLGIGDDGASNASPRATVSDAVELGARWTPVAWLSVHAAAFATFIERESVFDHVSGTNLELNGTRRVGGELVVEARPVSWLRVSADATLVDARFVASGNAVPFAPPVAGAVRASVEHPSGVRAGLRLLAVGPRPLPNGATGAALVRTDAVLGYRVGRFFADLEVENVLARALREGEYHYASHWIPDTPASALPTLHTTAGPPLNARLTLGARF